jgi:hypothetical protein
MVQEADTWPIVWILKDKNPYDKKAKLIKAKIASLVPNLARWVYWEVWVLTDADIENYIKTVPNLKNKQDTNKAILAMTLKMLANWYKDRLQSLARANQDVSRFWWTYKAIDNTVNQLLSEIWTQAESSVLQNTGQFWTTYNLKPKQ